MTAVVTGASSGLGLEIAKILSAKGYELILVARNKEKLQDISQNIKTECHIISLDLSEEKNCFLLYEKVKDKNVSVLINAAGFGVFGEFYKTSLEKEINMIELDIKALHILTKLFYNCFKARGEGHILNISSSAGYMPGPLFSSYYAAKSYVLRLSQAIFEEEKKMNGRVVVSAFCPGPVDTNFNNNAGIHSSVKPMDVKKAAKYAVDGLFKGKSVIVPGFSMKAGLFFSKILPEKFVIKLTYDIQKRKT